jgi:hypothetical protein
MFKIINIIFLNHGNNKYNLFLSKDFKKNKK